jgi:hypothetical protein
MNVIKSENYKDYTVRIFIDEDADSPRNYDNLGVIYAWHKRMNLGDKEIDPSQFESVEEMFDSVRESQSDIFISLRAYEHSGIALSTGREGLFGDRWDSFDIGFIHVPTSQILNEYSVKEINEETRTKALVVIESELSAYNSYLSGEAYGYMITAPWGGDLDSCWGFIGDMKYPLKEARSVVDRAIVREQEAERFVATQFAL